MCNIDLGIALLPSPKPSRLATTTFYAGAFPCKVNARQCNSKEMRSHLDYQAQLTKLLIKLSIQIEKKDHLILLSFTGEALDPRMFMTELFPTTINPLLCNQDPKQSRVLQWSIFKDHVVLLELQHFIVCVTLANTHNQLTSLNFTAHQPLWHTTHGVHRNKVNLLIKINVLLLMNNLLCDNKCVIAHALWI